MSFIPSKVWLSEVWRRAFWQNLFRPRLSLQILKGVGLSLGVTLIAMGVLAYYSAEDEIFEIYDAQLVSSATILWSMTKDEHGLPPEVLADQDLPLDADDRRFLDKYGKWRRFRVWQDGQLILSSSNDGNAASPPTATGFSDRTLNGQAWRIYTFHAPDSTAVVEVGEMEAVRFKLIRHLLRDVLAPLSLALPLVLLSIWLGTKWGLRSLERFAKAIAQRSVDDLSALDVEGAPEEIIPVARSVNALMADLSQSLDQERHFTDSAAHELRTPLATLSAQANVVLNAVTPEERAVAGDDLRHGIDRASRLIEQLLTLARVRHRTSDFTTFNLYDCIRDAIRDVYPKVVSKKMSVSLSGDEGAFVTSNPALLSILIGNLLDNAVKYAPPASEIRVSVADGAICVTDNGPGIPPGERELVFNRFYRSNKMTQEGSGLGLSIVRDIAHLLDARVTLGETGHGSGLRVHVDLPG